MSNVHEPIDLSLRHHKRRREEHHVSRRWMWSSGAQRPRDDPLFQQLHLKARRDLPVAGEVSLRRTILHELHRRQEPFTTPDFSCIRMATKRRHQGCMEPLTHLHRVVAEPLALEDLDVPQRHRASSDLRA